MEAISSNLKKYEESLTKPASDTDTDGAKDKVDKALAKLTDLKPILEKKCSGCFDYQPRIGYQNKGPI